jgi:2-methylcitrate dehydratase
MDEERVMPTIAERMADFALGTTPDDVPPEVLAQAARLVADTLACGVGAVDGEAPRILRAEAVHRARHAESTLLGTGERVDAGLAALTNTALVRYLDANDLYAGPPGVDTGHFSDAIPALLAVAESAGCAGHEFLTMVVVAYELQAALCHAFSWMRSGFHTAELVGVAVPVAAARARDLTPTTAVHAVGIAVSTGLVLQSWLKPSGGVSMLKSAGPALSARRGLEALDLAARGLTAPRDALETFFTAHGGADVAAFERLGQPYRLPRTLIKRFPAQIYTQAAIEGALALRARGLDPDALETVTVYGHQGTCAGVQGSPAAYTPVTREDADHSTPFVVASALLHGRFDEQSYAGEPWRSPAMRALMARVQLVVDPERQRLFEQEARLGCRLVAETRGGRRDEVTVDQPSGHPDRPLSDEELLGKMESLVASRLGPGAAQRLLDACLALRHAATVREVIATVIGQRR